MGKPKYKFNPESLSFDRISLSIRDYILRFFAYFLGSLLIALIYALIYFNFFDSDKGDEGGESYNQHATS